MSHSEAAAPQEGEAKAKSKSGPGLLVWIIIAVLAVGGGIATPVLAAKFLGGSEPAEGHAGEDTEHGDGHGEEHGEEHGEK